MFGLAGVYRCTRSFYRNESEPELLRVIIWLKCKYLQQIIACRKLGALSDSFRPQIIIIL